MIFFFNPSSARGDPLPAAFRVSAFVKQEGVGAAAEGLFCSRHSWKREMSPCPLTPNKARGIFGDILEKMQRCLLFIGRPDVFLLKRWASLLGVRLPPVGLFPSPFSFLCEFTC